MLPLHLSAVGGGSTLCAKVSSLYLYQQYSLLLPPDDGYIGEQVADVRHLVFHRLVLSRATGRNLLYPVRRRQRAAHPGDHRAEPGGVLLAAADASKDGAAARYQSKRPGAVESTVLRRRDPNDDGAGDDLRGGSRLFSSTSGESSEAI